MGDVWLARNEALDIDVAVKLLRKEAEGPDAGSRFLREARAAARLTHPATVRIFDFGIAEGGEPFIVMERLIGEDLATLLQRRGRFPAIHAVRTILPIVHALASAHAKGVIHRDLKPENVFLARADGDRIEPKVVDFGVAKLDLPKELSLTKNGVLLGSPAYMPPEQAQGTGVDHRADIWSLAVVLYEMVAGVRPFDGKTHNAVLIAIGRDEPRPITDLSAGDEDLWNIVAKGLCKDRRQRWESMRAFGEALAGWAIARGASEDITGHAIEATWRDSSDEVVTFGPSPPPPTVRREPVDTLRRASLRYKHWRWVAAAVAAAVLLLVVAWWKRVRSVPDQARESNQAQRYQPVVAPLPADTPTSAATPPPVVDAPPSAKPAAPGTKSARPVPVRTLSQLPVDGTPAHPPRATRRPTSTTRAR
jgi:serine/threonine-protein kinase